MTLTAVMAITAGYSWRDGLSLGQIELDVPGNINPDVSIRTYATGHRLNSPISSAKSPRVLFPDFVSSAEPNWETTDDSTDREDRQDISEPVDLPSPPLLRQTTDPPRQLIRSVQPDQGIELPPDSELPLHRPSYDHAAGTTMDVASSAGTLGIGPDSFALTTATPCLLVSDESGRAVVSRLYARGPSGPIVLLPDGSLAWPDGEVATDRPFRPLSAQQLKLALLSGPFRGFRTVERPPYLVLTQGSDAFARSAADLLQRLYQDLTACLEDGGMPVSEPVFPLVAVIYRDEEAFQSYRKVDPDVRAYYEIITNRIVFFESSEQDRRAPELASLRRPQTIAHEGVHQILQNVGIQPRLASWPAWLVEGLAEYFAPSSSGPARDGATAEWGEFGRSNFGRVNPFHMATLIDLQDPAALYAHLRRPGPGQVAPERARLGPDESWVTHLIIRAELSPTDYALAWSLTHFLALNHSDAFRSYLMTLRGRTPLDPRTPGQDLEDFVVTLGLNPTTLAPKIDRHLASLRYERVPYYAVQFEQGVGSGLVRRGGLVCPSPTMISQWLQTQSIPDAGPMLWWATPFDSRNQARAACETWLLNATR